MNKTNNLDGLETLKTLGKARKDTTNALRNFIKTYKELGYDENTMLLNLDDIISDVTDGKMYLEESDTFNSIATIEATKR